MLPEIDQKFAELKQKYGKDSISRVEAMMYAGPNDRDLLQKDAKWVMPGLSKGGWLETADFAQLTPSVNALQDNAGQIKDEINTLMAQQPDKVAAYKHYLMTKNDWKAFYLFKDGKPTADNNEVPTTRRIFNNELKDWICPLLEMHFSILEGGAVIAPHCDLWNFTINLHFAVDIPEDCAIKVANETRNWEEGKCLLFDYSYLHEAWNHSDKKRICLLMDIWHPEVTEPEKEALLFFITEIRKYF